MSHRGDRSVQVNEAHVFHLRDGKVTEFWNASTGAPVREPVHGRGACIL